MQHLIPRLKLTNGTGPEKASPDRHFANSRRRLSALSDRAGERLPGGRLEEKFEIIECIGKGATSLVFRVRHRMLEKEMAVKVLIGPDRADVQLRRRFFREASVLAALSHPGIVRVHTYGDDESFAYVAMDLIEGESLQQVMERRRLTVEEIVRLGALVASALAEVHKQGIVHRDVKPANIMLTGSAHRPQPVLVDFGSSIALGNTQRLTHADSIIGTPVYMSPEQFTESQIDARSDIYALGCVLYELVSGELPFATTTLYATAIAHAKERPPALPSNTPGWLASLIMAMLEKSPDQRPQTMDVVAQALAQERWNVRPKVNLHEVLGFQTARRMWVTSALCSLTAMVMVAIALPLTSHQDSINVYHAALNDYESHFNLTHADKTRMLAEFQQSLELDAVDHRLDVCRELDCKLKCAELTEDVDSRWHQLTGAYAFVLEHNLMGQTAIAWLADQLRDCVVTRPSYAVEATEILQGLDSFSNRANDPNLTIRRAIVFCWVMRGRADVGARLVHAYRQGLYGGEGRFWGTFRDYLVRWERSHIR